MNLGLIIMERVLPSLDRDLDIHRWSGNERKVRELFDTRKNSGKVRKVFPINRN